MENKKISKFLILTKNYFFTFPINLIEIFLDKV